jgi:hypothetical protein
MCRIGDRIRRLLNPATCFTEDQKNYLIQTRDKLAKWLNLAQAGTLGESLKDDPVIVALDIADIANKLYDWYVPPFSINKIILTEDELNSIINDLSSKGGLQNWLRLDDKYYTTNMDTIKQIIKWDWTDTRKYLEDTFDCDKFATYFKSRMAIDFGINAIGIVLDYSSAHAYNIIITKDNQGVKWYLYEPQTDNIFTYEDREKVFYKMENYYLIL